MAGPSTLFQTGVHGSRPAASAGCVLYSCTTHSLIYRSDGSSWTTFLTIPTGTGVATDPLFDAKGDSAWGTGADTAAKLTAGSNGMVPVFDSSQSQGVKAAYPPGYELSYVEKTTNTSITSTSNAAPTTIVTAAAVTYDGAPVVVEFYSPYMAAKPSTTDADISLVLWDDTANASIGEMGYAISQANNAGGSYRPVLVRRRFTPAAGSRIYSIRSYVGVANGTIAGGAGGAGVNMPAYVRITKV